MDDLATANGGELAGAQMGTVVAANRLYVDSDWLEGVERAEESDGRRTADLVVPRTGGWLVSPTPAPTPTQMQPGSFGFVLCPLQPLTCGPSFILVNPNLALTLTQVRVLKAEESTRAVTGARRLRVWLEPVGRLRVDDDEAALAAHPAGYLLATGTSSSIGAGGRESPAGVVGVDEVDAVDVAPVRCVCVVGLAHCNGMVAQLASAQMRVGLMSDAAPRLYELASRTDSYDELML